MIVLVVQIAKQNYNPLAIVDVGNKTYFSQGKMKRSPAISISTHSKYHPLLGPVPSCPIVSLSSLPGEYTGLNEVVRRESSDWYRVRYFRGRVSNFNKSEAGKHCFLAPDRLKFDTLPRKYRTLSLNIEDEHM